MSASLPHDLALSVTYFPETHEIFAVVYGCNDSQIQEIEQRIKSAGSKTEHPFLLVGLFVELERKRLVNLANTLIDRFTLKSRHLEKGLWNTSTAMDAEKAEENLKLCFQSRELVGYLRAVKQQLHKFLAEIEALDSYLMLGVADYKGPKKQTSRRDRLLDAGQQMKERIQDIMIEYDDKMDECDMLVGNTSLAMQTVSISTEYIFTM